MRPVAIVVPCYNEEQRLNRFAFHRFLSDELRVRFVFVNDGSRDGTLARLQELQSACQPGHIDIVDLPKNGGKAEAVRHGMRHALASGADLIGFWDADLATPLDEVPAFIRAFNRYPEIEMVVGSRLTLLGHSVQRNPKRSLLGRCFATAASLVLGIRLQDTQCGAKMFRRSRFLAAVLEQPFQSRWIFDVELLARWRQLRALGAPCLISSLYEQPLDTWVEVGGSRLKATDFLKAPWELWQIAWSSRGPAPANVQQIANTPLELTGPSVAPVIRKVA
ncbi:MAG: glycosyltransferase [Planctomycetota bacterium]|nr:MAG: glycosyltransferase [Planctomycetota bacterium]